MNTAINEKRPELINRKDVIFQQDNVRPHTSLVTHQKLRELGYQLLMRPSYNPNLASSDFHLFRQLQSSLNGKTFDKDEAIKSHLVQFFTEKGQQFYVRGKINLPKSWPKVIEQKGKYIIDYSSYSFNKMYLLSFKKKHNFFRDNPIYQIKSIFLRCNIKGKYCIILIKLQSDFFN